MPRLITQKYFVIDGPHTYLCTRHRPTWTWNARRCRSR